MLVEALLSLLTPVFWARRLKFLLPLSAKIRAAFLEDGSIWAIIAASTFTKEGISYNGKKNRLSYFRDDFELNMLRVVRLLLLQKED